MTMDDESPSPPPPPPRPRPPPPERQNGDFVSGTTNGNTNTSSGSANLPVNLQLVQMAAATPLPADECIDDDKIPGLEPSNSNGTEQTSDQSYYSRGQSETWDDNKPIREIEAERKSGNIFRRKIVIVALVVVILIIGVAAGVARSNKEKSQASAGAQEQDQKDIDSEQLVTAVPTQGPTLSPTKNNEPVCAKQDEKAVSCGANAKRGRADACCVGLVCGEYEKGALASTMNTCVPPRADEHESNTNTPVPGPAVDDASMPYPAGWNGTELDEATLDLPPKPSCARGGARAQECGASPGNNGKRPKKCCPGFMCSISGGGSLCVRDPNGPIAFEALDDSMAYQPGHLTTTKDGMLLSAGLDCKVLATTGKAVKFTSKDATEAKSSITFHENPDFGATFPTKNGGWVYVSNAEVMREGGGVGAIYFDEEGNTVDYQMLLEGTSLNCGGGVTPWGTWASCEEVYDVGQIWEVDPLGVIPPRKTVLGGFTKQGARTGGRFESFAYDVRHKTTTPPRFFYTEDHPQGALRRFTPRNPDWTNPHDMLHGNGTIEYLVLTPTSRDNSTGTYYWTKSIMKGRKTAEAYFPGSEGIDAYEGTLFFITKELKAMYVLDLDGNTWDRRSTKHGVFDGSPDQLSRVIGDSEILYYTEEGGTDAGIHARDPTGRFFTILESPVYEDETSGLSFSPNGLHLYVAYQKNGILLDVWRTDGKPFSTKSLNIKYHNPSLNYVE